MTDKELTPELIVVDGERIIARLDAQGVAIRALREQVAELAALMKGGRSEEPLLYGKREAARMLGVSPRSVEHYIYAGLLETRLIGARRLIPAQALKKFAARDLPGRPHLTALGDKPEVA